MQSSETCSIAITLADSLEVMGNLAYLMRNKAPESREMLNYLGILDAEILRLNSVVRLYLPDIGSEVQA